MRVVLLVILVTVASTVCCSSRESILGDTASQERPRKAAQAAPLTKPKVKELVEKYIRSLELRSGIPSKPIAEDPIHITGPITNEFWGGSEYGIRSSFYARIHAMTGELLGFSNDIACKELGRKNVDEKDPEPTMTAEGISNVARQLLKRIDIRIDLSEEPNAKYTTSRLAPQSWMLEWRRKHGKHKFYSERLVVYINESVGILSLINGCTSDNPPDVPNPLDEEEASQKAIICAQALLRSDMVKGATLSPPSKAELQYVNPNGFLKDVHTLAVEPRARLSWVVHFKVKGPETAPVKVVVWIDAETGEGIGGDVPF